ncbi:MAG: nucleoside phosphorylase [Myxococcaceae bacterium]
MVESIIDPDLPISADGTVYHLACTGKQLADKFILVGDPGRVSTVAQHFDANSIEFRGNHREIHIITGKFQGVRISVISTGMGTDNMEIILNEIHALKEYNSQTKKWLSEEERQPSKIHLIRVGTSGSPLPTIQVGTLGITKHALGLDNTCRYYSNPKPSPASVIELEKFANSTELGKIGTYASMAHPEVTQALTKAAQDYDYVVGTTVSCSGFYGCQGRAIGQFREHLAIPNIIEILGIIPEIINIEMENSALCFLSDMLGYKAGTVCAIIGRRSGATREFVTPEQAEQSIQNAITVGLNALLALE